MSKNVIFIGSINMDMKHTVEEFPEEGTNENTNEILETNYTLDSLLSYYKSDSVEKKIFSSASVLYAAKIFEEMMNVVSKKEASAEVKDIDFSNVGRNDKCPCGSGKKYKNCCGK